MGATVFPTSIDKAYRANPAIPVTVVVVDGVAILIAPVTVSLMRLIGLDDFIKRGYDPKIFHQGSDWGFVLVHQSQVYVSPL